MNIDILVFWIFGFAVLSGALLTSFSRNLIHAASGLFLSLFAIAGIFVLSGADFVAVVQLIVYAGGILILILFGVMLTRRFSGEAVYTDNKNMLSSFLLCAGLATGIIIIVLRGNYPEQTEILNLNTPRALGVQILTNFLLPFEAVSILLLTALVGAAWLARRNPPEPRDILRNRK